LIAVVAQPKKKAAEQSVTLQRPRGHAPKRRKGARDDCRTN
jgi:hypothetical protein